jgi:hypothetical protein
MRRGSVGIIQKKKERYAGNKPRTPDDQEEGPHVIANASRVGHVFPGPIVTTRPSSWFRSCVIRAQMFAVTAEAKLQPLLDLCVNGPHMMLSFPERRQSVPICASGEG